MQSITKIKLVGVRKTEIVITNTDNEKLPTKESVKSEKEVFRHEDFNKAMAAIIPLSLKHFGNDDELQKRVRLQEIHFKYDNSGTSISLLFSQNYVGLLSGLDNQLSKINGSGKFELPYLHEDKKNTGFNKMPEQIRLAAMKILEEAQAFLGGKFAQQDMFGHTDEKGTDDESENEDDTENPSDLGTAEDDFKSSDTVENEEETI